MPLRDDTRHREARAFLRFLGPALIAVGLVLVVIGFGSFFSSFGSFGAPRYFWCAFVGIPVLGVGVAMTKFAYLGAVTRYMANEVAPVGKDTFNYLAHGTKDGVREIASAVGDGLRGVSGERTVEVVRCHKCNEENDADARFCKSCGAALLKTRACEGCGELNDPDARFCDRCGAPIAASSPPS